jgi:ribosomal protein L44E
VIDRGKPEFEPIVKELKKNERQYFCVECGNVATQTALFKIEGAVIVERFCDDCTSMNE